MNSPSNSLNKLESLWIFFVLSFILIINPLLICYYYIQPEFEFWVLMLTIVTIIFLGLSRIGGLGHFILFVFAFFQILTATHLFLAPAIKKHELKKAEQNNATQKEMIEQAR